jgi:hypothetical protein
MRCGSWYVRLITGINTSQIIITSIFDRWAGIWNHNSKVWLLAECSEESNQDKNEKIRIILDFES